MLLYLDLVKPVTLCIHLLQISVLHNKTQDAVVEGRLRPSAATWWTGRNIYVVFDSGPFALLWENI